MMIIEGFKVTNDGDYAYKVTDSRQLVLGHVVRHVKHDGVKLFRAFGEDFDSLSSAVAEFRKIRSAKPFPLTGDAFEVPNAEKVLR